MMIWNTLSSAWQVCMEEAWDAYLSGSIPVGAVVVNEDQEIIAQARNRVYEVSKNNEHYIFGNPLAHAELNALIVTDAKKHNLKNCTLYATLEPCPLCVGALYMSGIRHLEFAAIDPYSGSTNLLKKTLYLNKKKITVSRPRQVGLEMINQILCTEFYFSLNDEHARRMIARWKKQIPNVINKAERLFNLGIVREMKENAKPVSEVIDSITEYIRVS